MWWQVEIEFAGQCSAHGGDGKKARAVSFGGDQENSGEPLDMDISSEK